MSLVAKTKDGRILKEDETIRDTMGKKFVFHYATSTRKLFCTRYGDESPREYHSAIFNCIVYDTEEEADSDD